ncbi:MAG: hypothetical protein WDN28_28530 [Chthoniobacter sp.]
MKIHQLVLLTSLLASPWALAGHEVIDTKDTKQTVVEEPLFKDRELQFGDYALYSVGNGPSHVGLFRNHSWGEGGEVNFYFARYFGIGAEYSGSYAQESPDTDKGRLHNHIVDLDHVGGNLFFRIPIESLHLAPYAFVGGGADFGDRKWGSAHAGLGFEYRIIQHFLPKIVAERVGFFADARWTYLGDRYFRMITRAAAT